jgi:ATP-dependent Clp protease ATP-binding subunit ClpB
MLARMYIRATRTRSTSTGEAYLSHRLVRTDGKVRTMDFKNTVIVMTSNLGSQMIQQMSGNDYQVIKLAVMGEVKTHFRPEFVNRIDKIVVFHALDEKHIAGIARIQLGYLEKRLARLEIKLAFDDAALA